MVSLCSLHYPRDVWGHLIHARFFLQFQRAFPSWRGSSTNSEACLTTVTWRARPKPSFGYARLTKSIWQRFPKGTFWALTPQLSWRPRTRFFWADTPTWMAICKNRKNGWSWRPCRRPRRPRLATRPASAWTSLIKCWTIYSKKCRVIFELYYWTFFVDFEVPFWSLFESF